MTRAASAPASIAGTSARERLERGRYSEEMPEEDLGVGDGAARRGVRGDALDGSKRERLLDDELDGADAGERCDGAAGHDAELRGERGDGDEAEVGTAREQRARALRGLGELDLVASAQLRLQRIVTEVPHERSGVEEVDSSDAKSYRTSLKKHRTSLAPDGNDLFVGSKSTRTRGTLVRRSRPFADRSS